MLGLYSFFLHLLKLLRHYSFFGGSFAVNVCNFCFVLAEGSNWFKQDRYLKEICVIF